MTEAVRTLYNEKKNTMHSPKVEAMADLCCSRNRTVAACREAFDLSLSGHIGLQAERVFENRKRKPLRDPADFYDSAARLAGKRLGEQAEREVREALSYGAICTADHHGALFGAQSWQGDLLFALLLYKMGYGGRHIPVLSGGQVDIGNVTYARGICVYTDRDEKLYLPVFRKRDHNKMPICCDAIRPERLELFRKQYIRKLADKKTALALEEIIKEIYEDEMVLSSENFASQVTVMGEKLSSHLFTGPKDPLMTYLEVEEVVRPLLIEELSEDDSLILRILKDKELRKALSFIKTGSGAPLSDLLFCSPDETGRKVFLRLHEDASFTGQTIDGRVVSLSAEPDIMIELLDRKKLVPGLFTIALLLAFERGISWMGGIFQSVYLPDWQRAAALLLKGCGCGAEADQILGLDCRGYLNGPAFALYPGDFFAQIAGPVEMWIRGISFSRVRELAERTGLWDSHMIGLSEIYYDLSAKTERPSGWYRMIAEDLYGVYSENLL